MTPFKLRQHHTSPAWQRPALSSPGALRSGSQCHGHGVARPWLRGQGMCSCTACKKYRSMAAEVTGCATTTGLCMASAACYSLCAAAVTELFMPTTCLPSTAWSLKVETTAEVSATRGTGTEMKPLRHESPLSCWRKRNCHSLHSSSEVPPSPEPRALWSRSRGRQGAAGDPCTSRPQYSPVSAIHFLLPTSPKIDR